MPVPRRLVAAASGALLAAVLVACASPGPAKEPQVSLPPQMACNAPPPASASSPPPLVAHKPPVAGQMTDAARGANRLFEQEKFAEALPAFEKVVRGETGDDQGNREIAEYHAAICRYRTGDKPGAAQAFAKIGRSPDHLKHAETFLWLMKLDQEGVAPLDLGLMSTLNEDEIGKFNNPQQRSLFWPFAYRMGRLRYQQGHLAEAESLFSKIDERSSYHDEAARCLAQLNELKAREKKAREEQEARARAAASASASASASAPAPAVSSAPRPAAH